MDRQLLNNAAAIDKDIKAARRALMDILDDIEDKIVTLIMKETEPQMQQALLEAIEEVTDKIEDAILDCPKKDPIVTRFSKIR